MENNKYNIAVLMELEDRHVEKFKVLENIADISYLRNKENKLDEISDEDLKKYDIIFGNPSRKILKNATSLKFLQLATAGSDIYSLKNLYANENIVLANASGAFGMAMSEAMIGIHLTLIKNLHKYRDNQNDCNWHPEGKAGAIYGSTVMCIGVGDIGSNYSKKLKAMGAYVIGVRRTMSDKPDFLDEVYTIENIEDVISRADVIAVCLPNTEKTKHLLNKSLMSKMKKTAFIINVGRGTTIDTDALCFMLENNLLAGAGLDVTDPEPLPKEHKLWKMKNVFITPHITGTFNVDRTHDLVVDIGISNILKFIKGETLTKTVDFDQKY